MFEQFKQMPKGMQLVMGGLAAACIIAVASLYSPRAIPIVLIGLVLVILLIVLWHLYQNWKSRQRAKALSGSLSANSSAAPSSISDPASRAKLDALRQNFGKGMEKFRAAGKDIYSLPWFVVCGEPGSGKTEAVRHCNVGFPPGLQDEMQGAGGTLNMHWWFTNQAVLLDTAGKLLFQEAPPGSTSEWSEFLKLLKKTRPNCPINGLLLVIPSESLIKDPFEDIQRKAGKIAQQLDTIQRTLDVRFPVFVLITKCDLINGFREFFSGVKDPQLQHQMTGWSNPQPLDTPFRPDEVDQHLQEVVRRVSRRRLGLMRDPVPADPGKRRVDEVDALFTLPASIGALAPRLRKYLETIFVAGEWSAKPLFLRGIYFTSALTEGSALDAELANVLGVPMDQLPEGKAWERERSFFLRDLFVQKIFKEKGLVTRASNTRQLLRRRQWILGGVVGIGLAVLVGVSYYAAGELKNSVGEEKSFWDAGKDSTWAAGEWRPILQKGPKYTGDEVIKIESRELSVPQYHEELRDRVSRDMNVSWVFKPLAALADDTNDRRRHAQRVLFEVSVVGPIVEVNRNLFSDLDTWSATNTRSLAALVQLEDAIHLRGQSGYSSDYPAEDFFEPLLRPTLGKMENADALTTQLSAVFRGTYFGQDVELGKWPPAWLSGGQSLNANRKLQAGWEALQKSLQAAREAQRDTFTTIDNGKFAVQRYNAAETAFLAAAAADRSSSSWKSNLDLAWSRLVTTRQEVETLVTNLKASTRLTSDITLTRAYKAAAERASEESNNASKMFRTVLQKQRDAAEAAKVKNRNYTLHAEIEGRLAVIEKERTPALNLKDQAEIDELDRLALKSLTAGGAPGYEVRSAIYQEAMRLVSPSLGDGVSLLGRLGESVGSQSQGLVSLRDKVSKLVDPARPEFGPSMQKLLDAAEVVGIESTLTQYRRELETEFAPTTGYPLGTGAPLTADQFRTKLSLLEKARADLGAKGVSDEMRRKLQAGFARAELLANFASALAGADGTPQNVRLVFVKDADQMVTAEKAIGGASGPRLKLSLVFPSMRMNGKVVSLRNPAASADAEKLPIDARLPKLELSKLATPEPRKPGDKDPPSVDLPDRWGLLRLIQKGAVRRADGKEWDAVVTYDNDKTQLVLAVTIVCDKPLPPLENWPTPSAK